MTKCMDKQFCKKRSIDEDNYPRNAVDKQPEPKRPPIFMVVYPKDEDPKLKAELENAENECQELKHAINQIKEDLTLAKRDRQILKQNLDLLWKVRKDLEYFLKTNRILMKSLHQALCTVSGSNTVARACSAEEQLNDVIKILESRMTHETIQLSEEKKIVREIDKLRGMKSKFIACDARRAEIRDAIANRDSLKPGDKEKLIGTEMDIVSKELQLFKEQIRQDTIQKQYIAKCVETWDAELKILKEKKDRASINVQELENKMEAPYENNRKLLKKAKDLAAEKNDEALKVLADSEVNKFMSVYSSDKEFRYSYVRRILPSLDSRQLSRDGRRRNPNEKSVVVQETTEMLKKEEQAEKRVAREARSAEREAEEQQKIRDKRARRKARKKATVNEVCSEEMKFVQQENAAMEQQEQVQAKGPISIPKIILDGKKATKNRAWAACAAVLLAVMVVLIGLSLLRT